MKAKTFQTFRDLQDDLGRIDASFAYIALCLKFFEHTAAASGNKTEFMKKQADHHSIRVYLRDDADPQLSVYYSSVVAVHSEWDRFLYALIDELQEFKYQKIDQGRKHDGESRLKFFLNEINAIAPGKLSDIPAILIDLCEYLRLLRNYYAHRATSPNKECEKVFEKIQKNSQSFPAKFGSLKLSSKCGKLCFDDVQILTIAVKLLAKEICIKLAPEPKLLLEHPDTQNFINRQKLKKNRVSENSLLLFFYDRFGLDRETAKKLVKFDNEALV
jgi:hypothetical protein